MIRSKINQQSPQVVIQFCTKKNTKKFTRLFLGFFLANKRRRRHGSEIENLLLEEEFMENCLGRNGKTSKPTNQLPNQEFLTVLKPLFLSLPTIENHKSLPSTKR